MTDTCSDQPQMEFKSPSMLSSTSASSTSAYSVKTNVDSIVVSPDITPEEVHNNIYALLGLTPSDGIKAIKELKSDPSKREVLLRFYVYISKVCFTLNPPLSTSPNKRWPTTLYKILSCSSIDNTLGCSPLEDLDMEAFDILFALGYYESLLEALFTIDHYHKIFWGDDNCLRSNFSRKSISLKIDACEKAIKDGLLHPNNCISNVKDIFSFWDSRGILPPCIKNDEYLSMVSIKG